MQISKTFDPNAQITLFKGDCLDLLRQIPDGSAQLVVTSPPYNLGKPYESRLDLSEYISQQRKVITECVRTLSHTGSICWQVGNYVDRGEIVPLDIVLYPVFESLGLQLRNRVVWHFGHGLHATKRFSGRYEVILWFTRSSDYYFDLDPIRVPQKYPNKKAFKGEKAGQLSCNPLGKNPSDVWDIPNVKSNHVEKTSHPCQFPVELIERLVLSMTRPGDLVVDPFMGVASTAIAALMHGRRSAGAEIMGEYYEEALFRIQQAASGGLKVRPMERSVHNPNGTTVYVPPKTVQISGLAQDRLFERVKPYGAE